ncbi:MAG: hypothetical protein KDC83_12935 [Flavobacteriales bacterium]|nr:hypothetical protein [Flavobacteriales bacterium]
MIFKRGILSIGIMILVLSVSGQNYVDLLKLTYLNSPFNTSDTLGDPVRVQEFSADATLPIPLRNGHALITGLYLEQLSVKSSPQNFNVRQVLGTQLKLGANINHGKRLSATYMFLPKISSDFVELGPNDFQFGGLVLYKLKKKENLNYQWGLYYNSELFGPFFVPLLGFHYLSKNEKFEMNFTLPVWADMNYKFNSFFSTGLTFSAFVRTYYLSPQSTLGRDEYLVKSSNEIYGYGQFSLSKSWLLQTKVGYSIGRRFSAYDINDKVVWGFSAFRFGDDRKELNPSFSDGILLQARLIYRFHIEKESVNENPIAD